MHRLAAVPDVAPPIFFNSGFMVLEPSLATFQDLQKKMHVLPSYDDGDQGFLNAYFGQKVYIFFSLNIFFFCQRKLDNDFTFHNSGIGFRSSTTLSSPRRAIPRPFTGSSTSSGGVSKSYIWLASSPGSAPSSAIVGAFPNVSFPVSGPCGGTTCSTSVPQALT